MTTSTARLDAETMIARARDYGLNTLSPVATMMMGGAYATAALAFADILRSPDERWLRLTLWFAIALNSTLLMMRVLHHNGLYAKPIASQLPMQLFAGFIMSAAFACLPLSTGGPDGWRFAMNLQLLMIPVSVFIGREFPRMLSADNYDEELRPLIAARLSHVRKFLRVFPFAALILVPLNVFVWVGRDIPGPWNDIFTATNALFSIIAVALIAWDVRQYRHLVDGIEEVRLRRAAWSLGIT
jgi:hypothetical protein